MMTIDGEPWYLMLPAVNASLNAIATVLLALGFYFIRRRDVDRHRNCMIAAFGVSAVFLVSYLTYHTLRQMSEGAGHTKWQAAGWLRPTYYTILITHVTLAAFVPWLAMAAVWQAIRRRFDRHKRITRVLWPMWMYVSITGVIVYAMLYQIHPRLVGGP